MPRRLIDTSIFDRERSREEARRAHKLENLYHSGQDKAWDGRGLLRDLIAKHGTPSLGTDQQLALGRVFSNLMWGEWAAWKISAQLADRLTDLEAKMAATSQAHDEARHFYVFHDYLAYLGVEIPDLDIGTRTLLESVLATDSVVEKLVGMQLYVESIALTLFKAVRELAIDPLLTELLGYYEIDEARHIGLGVQHAPNLVRGLSLPARVSLETFQLRILLAALVSLKYMEPSLRVLGVDPRSLAEVGKQRLITVVGLLDEANGRKVSGVAGPVVTRVFEASRELMFPVEPGLRARIFGVGRALVGQS